MQTQERIFNLTELGSVALGLLSRMKEYRVIAFSGELGSGKTTLISNICNLVGVEDAVSSPTFSLINEYLYRENGNEKRIFHVDAYRLGSAEEAKQVGIEECFDVDGYCFIEWPERIDQMLPEKLLKVYLSHTESGNRMIRIVG